MSFFVFGQLFVFCALIFYALSVECFSSRFKSAAIRAFTACVNSSAVVELKSVPVGVRCRYCLTSISCFVIVFYSLHFPLIKFII